MQKNWWIILILGAVLFACTTSAIFSPLNIGHDQDFVKVANPELGVFTTYGEENVFEHYSDYLWKYPKSRFNPLSNTFSWSVGKFTGANPLAMRLVFYLISWGTVALFFLLLVALNVQRLIAFAVAGLFIVGPHNEIWWLIGANETLGLFFFLLGCIWGIKYLKKPNSRRLVLLGIAFLLAAISKESFIVLLPFPIVFGIIYTHVQKGHAIRSIIREQRTLQLVIGGILAITLFGLIKVVFFGRPWGSEAGVDRVEVFWHNLSTFATAGHYWLLLLVGTLALLLEGKWKLRAIAIVMLVVAAWFASQLLAHVDKLVLTPVRYLMPAQLILLVLLALMLNRLTLAKNRIRLWVSLAVVGLLGAVAAKNMLINTSFYKAHGTIYHQLLAKANEDPNHKLAILMGPTDDPAFINTSATYLSLMFYNQPIQVLVDSGFKVSSPADLGLESAYQVLPLAQVSKQPTPDIIMLPSSEVEGKRKTPRSIPGYKPMQVSATYFNLSFSNLRDFSSEVFYTYYQRLD